MTIENGVVNWRCMDTNYTHITFVLDQSGSMASCWKDAIGGLASTISDQKQLDSKCTFSLFSFDNAVETHLDFADIKLVSEAVEEFGIHPRGSTALYDAIGRAVVQTGATLNALAENDRPGRVLVVIQTDGEENSSREYTAAKVKALIEEQTNKYSWDFMFVGADQNSVLTATRTLGVAAANTSFYSTTDTLETFNVLSSKMKNMRSASQDTYKTYAAFTQEEKTLMAGKE